MSVASCDQVAGTSAPSILKTTEPSELLMTLLRRSHTTVSNGSLPVSVNRRGTAAPRLGGIDAFLLAFGAASVSKFEFLLVRLLLGAAGCWRIFIEGLEASGRP